MEVHKEAIYFFGWKQWQVYAHFLTIQAYQKSRQKHSSCRNFTHGWPGRSQYFFNWKFLLEMLQLKDNRDSIKIFCKTDDRDNIKIFCKTDNSSLYDSVHSSIQILDQRLRIEMVILREMIERKEIAKISRLIYKEIFIYPKFGTGETIPVYTEIITLHSPCFYKIDYCKLYAWFSNIDVIWNLDVGKSHTMSLMCRLIVSYSDLY